MDYAGSMAKDGSEDISEIEEWVAFDPILE